MYISVSASVLIHRSECNAHVLDLIQENKQLIYMISVCLLPAITTTTVNLTILRNRRSRPYTDAGSINQKDDDLSLMKSDEPVRAYALLQPAALVSGVSSPPKQYLDD
jgi:hypothetical protein